MAQEFGLTGQFYDTFLGGGPVPYPRYRCKATAQERPGHTHLCKRPIDHDEHEHVCICTFKWEPVGARS